MNIIRNDGFRDFANFRDIQICYEGYVETDETWFREKPMKESFSCLYFAEKGSGYFTTPNKRVEIEPGYLYFIPSGTPIAFCSTPAATLLFCHFNLYIYGVDVFEDCTEITKKKIDVEDIKKLSEMYLSDDRYMHFMYKGEIVHLICELMREKQQNGEKKKISVTVVKALEFIRENMNAGITVGQIAEHCNCSKSTLTTAFRKEVCQSVGKYMMEIILSESQTLLLYSDLSIKEISDKLGFYDQFYFSKIFKKEYGISPLQFRKRERA